MSAMPAATCPICGPWSAQVVLTKRAEGQAYPLFRCAGCRLVFVHPPPRDEELRQYYHQLFLQEHDAKRTREEAIDQQLREQRFRRRLDELTQLVPCGRLLDIGCRDGLFLSLARKRGWDPHGVELSSATAEQVKQQGIPVVVGTLEEARFPEASFDTVTLWHLIEHVASPLALLREIRRILKPAGLLAIETPNVESRAFRRHGAEWEYLVLPQHLCYFGPQSLQSVLKRTGYQVVFWRSEGGTGLGAKFAQAGLGNVRLWLRKHYQELKPLRDVYLALFGWKAPTDDILIMYARVSSTSVDAKFLRA